MQMNKKATRLGIVASLVFSSTSALASLQLARNQGLSGVHTYSGSQADLGHFGDEASSVKNTDRSNAWVLYDDDNYRDRRFCIRPNQTINNLHDSRWRFGDKISSVKRLGSSSCRGYPTF
jgi:hypothetical protein